MLASDRRPLAISADLGEGKIDELPHKRVRLAVVQLLDQPRRPSTLRLM
jgi:hypothetical protein